VFFPALNVAHLRGTPEELYEKQKATNKSDVFSLGIILWEIVTRVLTGLYSRPYSEFKNMARPAFVCFLLTILLI